jgi:hypothetical protein
LHVFDKNRNRGKPWRGGRELPSRNCARGRVKAELRKEIISGAKRFLIEKFRNLTILKLAEGRLAE